MDNVEYQTLQDALRKKLNRPMGQRYMSDMKEGIYKEGIRAAMSILSAHQKCVNDAQWIFAGYGWVRCSKCASERPYITPLPHVCPKCGADMKNDDIFKR